jgi:cytochrome P450
MRDDLLTLMVAAHDTIGKALAWTWLLLAEHPAVAAQLRTELSSVLQGSTPLSAHMPRLVYTRAVMAEALRLFPPAWVVAREALKDCRVGHMPIAKGTILVMSQYLVHRDPRFFARADVFDPSRWCSPATTWRPKLAYFPFGAGPRACIGEGLAWMEGVLILATLAPTWDLKRSPGVSMMAEPGVTLGPRGPVLMRPVAVALGTTAGP